MKVYLRLKYGREQVIDGDAKIIDDFAGSYGKAIISKEGFFRVAINYFNVLLASRYFLAVENAEDLNQSPLL